MSGINLTYQQITCYYRIRIHNQEFQPGQSIDSINIIVLRHQISRETAKLVLCNLVKEMLIQSKTNTGSFVAKSQRTNDRCGRMISFYSPNIEQLILFPSVEAEGRNRRIIYFFHYNIPEEETRLVGGMVLEGFEAMFLIPYF